MNHRKTTWHCDSCQHLRWNKSCTCVHMYIETFRTLSPWKCLYQYLAIEISECELSWLCRGWFPRGDFKCVCVINRRSSGRSWRSWCSRYPTFERFNISRALHILIWPWYYLIFRLWGEFIRLKKIKVKRKGKGREGGGGSGGSQVAFWNYTLMYAYVSLLVMNISLGGLMFIPEQTALGKLFSGQPAPLEPGGSDLVGPGFRAPHHECTLLWHSPNRID